MQGVRPSGAYCSVAGPEGVSGVCGGVDKWE